MKSRVNYKKVLLGVLIITITLLSPFLLESNFGNNKFDYFLYLFISFPLIITTIIFLLERSIILSLLSYVFLNWLTFILIILIYRVINGTGVDGYSVIGLMAMMFLCLKYGIVLSVVFLVIKTLNALFKKISNVKVITDNHP